MLIMKIWVTHSWFHQKQLLYNRVDCIINIILISLKKYHTCTARVCIPQMMAFESLWKSCRLVLDPATKGWSAAWTFRSGRGDCYGEHIWLLLMKTACAKHKKNVQIYFDAKITINYNFFFFFFWKWQYLQNKNVKNTLSYTFYVDI